jgi:hypothetical protein
VNKVEILGHSGSALKIVTRRLSGYAKMKGGDCLSRRKLDRCGRWEEMMEYVQYFIIDFFQDYLEQRGGHCGISSVFFLLSL